MSVGEGRDVWADGDVGWTFDAGGICIVLFDERGGLGGPAVCAGVASAGSMDDVATVGERQLPVFFGRVQLARVSAVCMVEPTGADVSYIRDERAGRLHPGGLDRRLGEINPSGALVGELLGVLYADLGSSAPVGMEGLVFAPIMVEIA